MNKLAAFTIILLIILSAFFSCNKREKADFAAYAELSTHFKDPQGTARPKVYWWWLNGYIDTVKMKEELKAIKDAGLGGVDIFEIGFRPDGVVPAGPAFMSDESLKGITFAIKEATRLNLEVGLNLSSSWNAGGSWVKPEHAAKSLYFSKTSVKGGSKQEIRIPYPEITSKDERGRERIMQFKDNGRPVFSEEVALLAIPAGKAVEYLDTTKIINVSRFFDPVKEILQWDIPVGDWDIYRYVCSNSGEHLHLPSPLSEGPIIDHFDAAATEAHFMFFIDKLRPLLGGDFSKTSLKNFYLASFEAKKTVWTSMLASEFERINGYKIDKFLPYIFDSNCFSPELTASFKQDFGITLSELMINNHYKKGKEIANKYELNLISESGGPGPPLHNVPVDGIKALGALDIPRGEFWINHSRYDGTPDSIDLLMLVKEVSAASNLYGRKIVELEAFTSFQNWQEGPGNMKPIGDRAFAEGMNRPVIHGFTHNPEGTGYPGIVYYAGTHYNTKTTWWSKNKPFNDYLARISYILQETDFIADVLYYYGEQVPNFVTPKNTRFSVASGYDYEVIDTENLLNALTVEDGMLTLPYGAKFRMLALGELLGKNEKILQKLEKLVRQGAIITGIKPENTVHQDMINYLWTTETFDKKNKKDKIYTTSPIEILQSSGISTDFDYTDKQSSRLDYQHKSLPVLDYIHYSKGDLDFYFVRNTSGKWITRNCSFRQQNKGPELWHPVSGEIYPVNVYQAKGQHTEIPLCFAPYESFFIVFGENKTGNHYNSIEPVSELLRFTYTKDGIECMDEGTYQLITGTDKKDIENTTGLFVLDGSWDVTFDVDWGAPSKATFPGLISWTASTDDGIRFYSGTASYSKSFTYSEPLKNKMYLDLGKVAKVAEVWLNDQPLGITWTPPYRYDITKLIQQGENILRIEIVNTWSNRIIGDITGKGKKYTNTNVNVRGSQELLWTETPLMESGLLGPVAIYSVNAYSTLNNK